MHRRFRCNCVVQILDILKYSSLSSWTEPLFAWLGLRRLLVQISVPAHALQCHSSKFLSIILEVVGMAFQSMGGKGTPDEVPSPTLHQNWFQRPSDLKLPPSKSVIIMISQLSRARLEESKKADGHESQHSSVIPSTTMPLGTSLQNTKTRYELFDIYMWIILNSIVNLLPFLNKSSHPARVWSFRSHCYQEQE